MKFKKTNLWQDYSCNNNCIIYPCILYINVIFHQKTAYICAEADPQSVITYIFTWWIGWEKNYKIRFINILSFWYKRWSFIYLTSTIYILLYTIFVYFFQFIHLTQKTEISYQKLTYSSGKLFCTPNELLIILLPSVWVFSMALNVFFLYENRSSELFLLLFYKNYS